MTMPYDTTFSLYVHIPFCASRCDYCDFYSSVPVCIETGVDGNKHLNSTFENNYLNALHRQLISMCRTYTVSQWRSVYVGGGTPGLLSSVAITHLIAMIQQCAPLMAGAEVTVEVNPEDCSYNWLSHCYDGGVNRISVGIQSFNDVVLAGVHRRTSGLANRTVLSMLAFFSKEHEDFRWNADLIAGLPGETKESFLTGVRELLSYNPKHVSLYTLSLEVGTPLYRRLSGNGKSFAEVHKVEENADLLWFAGCDLLKNAGLQQYEVSNFAYPCYESSHNCSYWMLKNWLGIGPGASGSVFFNDGSGIRLVVPANVNSWLSTPEIWECERLEKKTCIKEFLMMGFRLKAGISTADFSTRFGSSFYDVFAPVWDLWRKKNKATECDNRAFLTEKGFLFLDDFISSCFELL